MSAIFITDLLLDILTLFILSSVLGGLVGLISDLRPNSYSTAMFVVT